MRNFLLSLSVPAPNLAFVRPDSALKAKGLMKSNLIEGVEEGSEPIIDTAEVGDEENDK